MNKREAILSGNIVKILFKLSLPLTLNNLIQISYSLTDMFFLGKLGSSPIAAIAFLDPVQAGILALAMGLNVAGISIISRNMGAGRYEEVNKNTGGIISVAVFSSLLISITGVFFTENFLDLMSVNDDIYDLCYAYLKPMLIGAPFIFFNQIYIGIKQGEGDTIKPFVLSLISLVLNVILNPIFILKLGLGIYGAALTTLIARGALGIYALWSLFSGKGLIKVKFKDLIVAKDRLIQIIKIAVPSGMSKIIYAIGKVILYSYCFKYGTKAMAAFATGNRLQDLVFVMMPSLGAATATLVGQNIGNKNIVRIDSIIKKTTQISFSIGILGGMLLIIFAREMAGLMLKDTEVLSKTVLYLRMTTGAFVFFAITHIYEGVFTSAGEAKFLMAMNFIKFWFLRIGLLVLFDRFINIGEYSIWVAFSLSNSVVLPYYIYVYRKKKWYRRSVALV